VGQEKSDAEKKSTPQGNVSDTIRGFEHWGNEPNLERGETKALTSNPACETPRMFRSRKKNGDNEEKEGRSCAREDERSSDFNENITEG